MPITYIKNNIFIALLLLFSTSSCSTKIERGLLQNLKELSSDKYEGRKTGTNGGKLAARIISDRFKTIGLKPYSNESYVQDFSFYTDDIKTDAENMIGYISGASEKAIVITAHYDHLGVKNGEIYNGADDNASGVAALFYLADYFSRNKPYHTLIFAAFDAEETGLKGSAYFVEKHLEKKQNLILNINMDMIGISPKNEIYIAGTNHFPLFKEFIPESKNAVKIRFGHDDINSNLDDWTHQSDHYSFFEKGIPFLYFGVENHKHYHKPTDVFENIDKKFYVNTVSNILETVKSIDEGLMKKTAFRETLIH